MDKIRFAHNEQMKRVCIKDALPDEVYCCPSCEEELTQRHGPTNEHCFAHKKGTECDAWGCMGEWHNAWQDSFPEENREVVLKSGDETHRADVYINNIILEFQDSPISSDELRKRINFYTKQGTLIFIFNQTKRYISQKDNICFWTDASRSIIPPNNINYFVILETEKELLLVNKQLSNWSRFSILESYTREEFIKSIHNSQFFMTIYQMQAESLKEDNKRLKDELNTYRKYKIEYEKQKLEYERIVRDAKGDANKLLKQKDTLIEDLRSQIAKGVAKGNKAVEREKLFKIAKKQLHDSVILEVDRYIRVAKTNDDRDRAYPRMLLEKN